MGSPPRFFLESFYDGTDDEWFFNSLVGIRPSTTYQKFIIAPQPVGDLKYVKASYETYMVLLWWIGLARMELSL